MGNADDVKTGGHIVSGSLFSATILIFIIIFCASAKSALEEKEDQMGFCLDRTFSYMIHLH